MIGISIAIFLLAMATSILESTYINYVRWGMGLASIIGISINAYLIYCSTRKKKSLTKIDLIQHGFLTGLIQTQIS